MFKYLWIVIVFAIEVMWLVMAVIQIADDIKRNKIMKYSRPVIQALKDATILRGWVLFHIAFLLGWSLIEFLRG